ncbi:MAG: PfkB family carbohydrate kinase [Candidatus Levyibacteriota bacterium]
MLIITGSLAYDYIMGFPGSFSDHILPEQTHNINVSFIVDNFAKRRGGTAGNVSYTLGLLRTPHILFSYAGKDFGEYKQAFEELGIKTNHVAIDDNDYTATGFAMADKKQNQIWGFYNGATAKNATLDLKKVAKKTDYVLVGPQGAEGSLSFIKQSVEREIPYMFDPGFILTQISNTDLLFGLKHAETIIGNDYEMRSINNRIRDFATIEKSKIIITTLGEKGATIDIRKKRYKIPPVKVTKIGATMGAGDAWRGGYLAGRVLGFDYEISGRMGAVASSFAVEHVGSQDQTFSLKQFAKRYKDAYNENLKL